MKSEILAPMVALVAWSLVVLVWLVVARAPAMKKAGIDIGTARGGRPGGLDGVLPESAMWPAHNYLHLMEQPTLFYAVCAVLAIVGAGNGVNAWLAWGYVGLRVGHSLVQNTSNIIKYRFALFALSTLALTALTLHAGMALYYRQ